MRQAANEALEEANSDDDEWEDDPDALDLGSASVKQSLMEFAEETPYSNRQPDDETQTYLVQWFHEAANRPNFAQYFNALTTEEQTKLRSYG